MQLAVDIWLSSHVCSFHVNVHSVGLFAWLRVCAFVCRVCVCVCVVLVPFVACVGVLLLLLLLLLLFVLSVAPRVQHADLALADMIVLQDVNFPWADNVPSVSVSVSVAFSALCRARPRITVAGLRLE